MLNFAEYRRRPDRLADHLPWAALVAPGIVLNKDGAFQRTLRFRGPDLESATEAELIGVAARFNNVARRFGSGWALFFEAERFAAADYPESAFPDAASWLVDRERRAGFEGTGHFESACHLTLYYMPPPDTVSRAERWLIEKERAERARVWQDDLGGFVAETDRVADLLKGFIPELRVLDDAETLTYLHRAVSSRRHRIDPPETPIYLDAVLVDEPLSGGLEPMLGARHLRTLTVPGFPNLTRPGLLDALNHLALPYRWMTRFIALDKTHATRELTKLRRQWFAKRKSVTALLREVIYNEPAPLLDTDADNKVVDADLALQALGGDHVSFGYLTTTITVADEDAEVADDHRRAVERVVTGAGFTVIRESVNAVEAWLGSLPGHVYANIRQPIVHTLNLAHLMPLSSVWAGPARNEHLGGPVLLHAESEAITIIEFKLTTLAGFVLVPFALWTKTAFLAERVLGNVVASGVKVMLLAVIIGIGSGFFTDFVTALQGREPNLNDAMALVLASLALFGLGIFGPGIAAGLVSGAPQLGAGAAVGATGGAAAGAALVGGMALGAARMGSSAGLSALRAGTGMGTATAGAVGMGPAAGAAASSSTGMSSSMAAGTPDWARRLRAEQRRRTHTQTTMQAIREGDRPGAGANPSFDDGRS